ncbi:MAG: L,D-transpeptidase [Roseivivax sp.]|nr:L,D-transpeptidase [Roseivivax sp.]
MHRFLASLLCAATVTLAPIVAGATPLVARVDIASQTMTVYQDGKPTFEWPVSTARPGKVTPRGTWTAQWLSKHHRSSRYNNAPMPFAIFFNGNYAIHGTDQINRLGRPASAGCVRLHPDHAAKLFAMTRDVGLSNMQVVIVN